MPGTHSLVSLSARGREEGLRTRAYTATAMRRPRPKPGSVTPAPRVPGTHSPVSPPQQWGRDRGIGRKGREFPELGDSQPGRRRSGRGCGLDSTRPSHGAIDRRGCGRPSWALLDLHEAPLGRHGLHSVGAFDCGMGRRRRSRTAAFDCHGAALARHAATQPAARVRYDLPGGRGSGVVGEP